MKNYSNKIINGDCKEVLKTLEDNSVDSIVTDPPAGISFMGKAWDDDKGGRDEWIKWLSEVMTEAKRVLKPGGHALVWALPRTSHWTGTALENAGFEVRDCVYHLFGSGFPKSLDISKAIDKQAGAERKPIGKSPNARSSHGKNPISMQSSPESENYSLTEPSTPEAKQWEGWGTALKPAVEKWWWATKPYTVSYLSDIMVQRITKAICQLPLYAKGVKKSSELNRSVSGEDVDSALWTAVEKCNTQADLHALMATLPLKSVIPLSLSIGLLWLNILDELSERENMFTTETKTSLITELKILNSLALATIQESIIQDAQDGTEKNVSVVASIFNVVCAKLQSIQLPTAQESAIGRSEIWLVRKPLSEKTVAENVLKHGTGGLNIDGSRIGTDEFSKDIGTKRPQNDDYVFKSFDENTRPSGSGASSSLGRFPANLTHDGSDVILAEFAKAGESKGWASQKHNSFNPYGGNSLEESKTEREGFHEGYNDTGSPARFFYTAKPSSSEKNLMYGEFEERQTTGGGGLGLSSPELRQAASAYGSVKAPAKNFHPTVKAQSLMCYLIKLITPPKGIVLDFFCGSGSTLLAAQTLGHPWIGIEIDPEYVKIAEGRLKQGVLNF